MLVFILFLWKLLLFAPPFPLVVANVRIALLGTE